MVTREKLHDPDLEDPIVNEVRETRRRLSAKFDNDLDRILEDLKRREKESGRTYVDRSQPPIISTPIVPIDTPIDHPSQPANE